MPTRRHGDLPTGTVTFLFTDIVGSTQLLRTLGPDDYRIALEAHTELIRDALAEAGGVEVSTEGDAAFAVFTSATRAVAAAVEAQRRLAAHTWPGNEPVRVRMGVHTGEGLLRAEGYVGIAVHHGARIADAAHGEQILVSAATRSLVEQALPDGVGLIDLGPHRLKDFDEPERIYQVTAPHLPRDLPPLRTPGVPATNLPATLGSFVGREDEVTAIAGLLDEHRLVTLTGPGGVGKTRLAIEAARRHADVRADGVWLVELASLNDPELVPSAIATVLDISEQTEAPTLDVLVPALEQRDTLLVLDNFEHVGEAAAAVAHLLAAAPGLRCLVTSRSRLGISGEQSYPVPPLTVPPSDMQLPPDALSRYGSVELFLLRAASTDPEFSLTDDNAAPIAGIAVRLDGLPLAIELAAARVTVLSPTEILRRLEDQLLSVLRTPRPDVAARQQTLDATMRWSYDLLDGTEAATFRRLGVFVGGFTLDAAEAVVAPEDEVDVLESITALVDNSLLRRAHPLGHRSRYEMLATVRDLALRELEARDERTDTADRHAAYHLALVEEAEPALEAVDVGPWMERIDATFDDLRAAYEHLLVHDPPRALRLFAALRHWWPRSMRLAQHRVWIDRARTVPAEQADDADRVVALLHTALVHAGEDANAARDVVTEAVELARSAGSGPVLAEALFALGNAHRMSGDYEAARRAIDDSLALNRRLGRTVGETDALNILGILARYAGDLDRSAAHHVEALDLARRRNEPLAESWSLGCLGVVERRRGAYRRAEELFTEALAIEREVDDNPTVAEDLFFLADLARRQGHIDRAEDLLRESLDRTLDADNEIVLGWILDAAGAIAHARGDSAGALLLYAAGDALRGRVGAPLNPSERELRDEDEAAARASLPADVAAAAWTEGTEMSRDGAISLVRDLIGDQPTGDTGAPSD